MSQQLNLDLMLGHGIFAEQRVIQFVPDNGDSKDDNQYTIGMSDFVNIDRALTLLESLNSDPITIKICSVGGSVDAALAILGRIKSSPCYIITEGYGIIASAATILLACGDKRRVSKYATMMHHEASYGISGRHSEAKAQVKRVEVSEMQWAKYMAEFSNQPASFYKKAGVYIDQYWNSDELLEFGIVDEIF